MPAKSQTAFVITANRLSDGLVLYLAADGCWAERLDDALVTLDAEERDRLLASAKGRELEVCGPYVLELAVAPDGTRGLSMRERLRALGPGDVLRRLGY